MEFLRRAKLMKKGTAASWSFPYIYKKFLSEQERYIDCTRITGIFLIVDDYRSDRLAFRVWLWYISEKKLLVKIQKNEDPKAEKK